MALKKDIKQADGVVTNYHRILYINVTVNRQNSIAVLSYVDSESRDNEKESIMAQPYRKAISYVTAYDPKMSIETAYAFLKTLPEFEGSIDV